jgi:hypothetical protein
MMHRRTLLGTAGGAAVLAAIAPPAAAQLFGAPEPDLWPRWQAHDPDSTARIDHGAWDGLLGRYVSTHPDGINRVDYAGWRGAGRGGLRGYIDALAAVPISRRNRAEQFAYWVNLYNALTVDVVLDHYPVSSIRDIDISPGMFSTGPWGRALVAVEGADLTLDDIEHRILRPIWRDPRIHYAVNCASLGCPNLLRRAFTGTNLETLLTEGARAYVNHPRGAEVRDGRLFVSSIYEWFQEDFGGSDTGVIAHLRRHAGTGLASRLDGITRIAGDSYDWSLNGAAGAG